MRKMSKRYAASGFLSLVVVIGLSAVVWTGMAFANGGNAGPSKERISSVNTYSDNGLTCPSPAGVPSAVASLVTRVTQDSRFTNIAEGLPYVFQYYTNATGISVTTGGLLLDGPTQNGSVAGGVTRYLPNEIEMVFYTYGPGTTCQAAGSASASRGIVVQIPVDADGGGGFNMTGAFFAPINTSPM